MKETLLPLYSIYMKIVCYSSMLFWKFSLLVSNGPPTIQFVVTFTNIALTIGSTLFLASLSESIQTISYKSITRNIVHVKLKEAIYNECQCEVSDASPCSVENGCLNVLCQVECSPIVCKAKEKCKNQNFRRGTRVSLQVRETGAKGYGLFAMEDIQAGQFIIEYVGEVIDKVEFQKRFETINDGNFYFFALEEKVYIDARIYGNESRFSNHSCEPNAVGERWIRNENGQEHVHVGLFAKRKVHSVS